jgi:hypothetical protein
MLTVPMFARYMMEVTAGQPLQDIPWERPAGVKPNDTGGKLRTTADEVLADTQAPPPRPGAPPPANRAPAKPPAATTPATPTTPLPTAGKKPVPAR